MLLFVATCVEATRPPIAVSAEERKVPTLELVHAIEASLSMPQGARQLSAYVRYYSTETLDNAVTIRGIFVYDGTPARIESAFGSTATNFRWWL